MHNSLRVENKFGRMNGYCDWLGQVIKSKSEALEYFSAGTILAHQL